MSISKSNRMFETFRESRKRNLTEKMAKLNDPKYKEKEEFDTLKILSLLNNTEYHETDDFKFKDSLMREYKENIEKIKAQKEKIKQSYETCNGIAMMKHSQYMTMEQRRRAHKINLDHAVTLCIQNKEIVSNLLTCAANKIKDRIFVV